MEKSKKTNKEITPIVHAAIQKIFELDAVDSTELLSTEMYRLKPDEDHPIGCLGVDILLNDIKVFLPYERCEDIMCYPNGGFVAIEFVNLVLKSANIKSENGLPKHNGNDVCLGGDLKTE